MGDSVLILKMNVEENYQIPAELEISSLPALALYIRGSFQRFIGGIGKKMPSGNSLLRSYRMRHERPSPPIR